MIKNTRSMKLLALFVCVAFLPGCSSTTVARDFNGLSSPDGQVIGHLSQDNMALNLLMSKPLKGNASLEQTVADFTAAAKAERATKVRIVQSKVTKLWYIFFPFTLIITPVMSNVSGEAIA